VRGCGVHGHCAAAVVREAVACAIRAERVGAELV